MNWLENRLPPPIVGAAIAAAMWRIADVAPLLPLPAPAKWGLGFGLMVVGMAFVVAGFHAFLRAGTTIDPTRPSAASTLVVAGIYRVTRNPMYLGVASVLLGWAVLTQTWLGFLGPAIFVLFITRLQIRPEERALRAKFGAAFDDYAARVRRWL